MSLASAFARAAITNEHDAHRISSSRKNAILSDQRRLTGHNEDYTYFAKEAKKRRV